ncbi:RND transporter [Hymenobacter qilianensis]|uniref:RND transporter n=1 Tax=Hymenobacter qilianensis TaxID=1385715 RepID=A0ACB5PVM6_9BACT|nr:efflux transporter outer membrane subunit [Hymenobacter qilianensis]GGF76408.1 RND transporter [Hymenobacter qilianensis]
MAGCTRAPRYQAPDVASPPAWKNAPQAAAAPLPAPAPATVAQQPAIPAWWTVFNDPELTKLAEQTLGGNFSLKSAVARVDEARAAIRVATSTRQPEVTLDPQAYITRLSGLRPVPFALGGENGGATPTNGITQTQYYVPLNVSYEVDVWGRLRRGVQAARAESEASEAELRTVQLSLTADGATYYFGIRGLDAELAVLDSTLLARRQSLALTNARFTAGVDNEIAVRRAETELATVEASLFEAQRQRKGLEAALATVTGQTASAFTLAPRRGPLNAPQVPASVPAALLTTRPDLLQAERLLAATDSRLDAARLARLPTLLLNGFIGPQAADLRDLPRISDNYTYYLGGGISIPVFNGGRLRANQQIAQARYDAQAAEYRQRALVAFKEVETALADVQQTAAQLAAQQRALTAARQAGRLTLERYRRGLADYFQVVDADRITLNAARQRVQTQANQLRYTVQLVRALGGNWE